MEATDLADVGGCPLDVVPSTLHWYIYK